MKTIISASRRTDIPAYYLAWFMDKIREGKVVVRNPFYKKQFKTVSLDPDKVEWIVFWSRNYHKFLKNQQFFSDFSLFFHFTIISHHPMLEKACIPLGELIRQMEKLVSYFGSERIIWRYDPIICWEKAKKSQSNYKKTEFMMLCREFSAMGINKCYFSYVTDYHKFKRRFSVQYPNQNILLKNESKFPHILQEMRKISAEYNMSMYSCCDDSLIGENTLKGSCISGKLLNELNGSKTVSEAKIPTREDCGCTRSIDIGDYVKQPCYFGCIYCYANPVWK
jgi:hypothetical protein